MHPRPSVVSALLAALLILAAACGDDDSGESAADPAEVDCPSPVKVGEIGIIADAPVYIAMAQGYFEDEGIEVELARFPSAVDMVPLLASGQLHVGEGSPSSGFYNAVAEGLDITIVADNARTASGPDTHLALVMRPDLAEEIQDYSDLAGRTIAINAPSGGTEAQLVAALEEGGLTLDDVEVVYIPFPEMTGAAANKSIDLAIAIEPFITIGEGNGSFVQFKGNGEFYPDQQIGVLMYAPTFAEEEGCATAFMRAYLRGIRDFRAAFIDGSEDPDAVIEALVANTPVTDVALYDQMAYQDINPDGALNVDSLKADLEYYVETADVPDSIDLDEIIDTSFAEAAAEDLDG